MPVAQIEEGIVLAKVGKFELKRENKSNRSLRDISEKAKFKKSHYVNI